MASIALSPPKRVKATSQLVNIWPAVLLFYSFLIPPEVAVYFGSLRMGAYRLALLIVLPYIIYSFVKLRIRLHWLDFLLIVVAIWMPAALSYHHDVTFGLEAGGRQSYDMVIAYFLGRTCIDSFDKLRSLMLYILPGLFVVGALLFLESIAGQLLVRPFFQQLFGTSGEVGSELRSGSRLGLLRAYSVFIHPIHAGIFLSSFIVFYFLLFKIKQWRISGALVGILGFFSLSSAGILGIGFQLIFISYDWLQKQIRDLSWGLAMGAVGVFFFLIHLFSQNGIVTVIYNYLTLNPATGRFRTLIWQYAGDVALQNPWLGIGQNDYARPSWMGTPSIDAHYLFMAVRYGMPSALLYLLIAISIIMILGSRMASSRTNRSRDGFLALAICISVTLILMFTVTFWGAMLSWFNFLLGAALALTTWPQNLSDGNRKAMPQ
jgi:O-antigen ligase